VAAASAAASPSGGRRAVDGTAGANATEEALRALKVSQLCRRAAQAGAAETLINGCHDAARPAEALIALILALETPSPSTSRRLNMNSLPVSTAAAAAGSTHLELRGQSLRQLRQRAREVGVEEDQLEDAIDNDDPCQAVIRMIEDRAREAVSVDTLQGMGLKELRQQARELGIDADTLEDTLDDADPKAAVIALVHQGRETIKRESELKATQIRNELGGLRVMELHRRCSCEAGIDAGRIEDAMDSDSPKQALIELLLLARVRLAPAPSSVCAVQAEEDGHSGGGGGGGGGDRGDHEGGGEPLVALRRELLDLHLTELMRRARRSGVAEEELEDTMDSDAPKAAVISLLLQRAQSAAEAQLAKADKLGRLGLKQLRREARQAGVDETHLDDAMDSADPKAAVISLLLSAPPTPPTHGDPHGGRGMESRPHFGSAAIAARQGQPHSRGVDSPSQNLHTASTAAAATASVALAAESHEAPIPGNARHVMLSYQVSAVAAYTFNSTDFV
jgi:lambda repressor-like predicted transcriptional regulator